MLLTISYLVGKKMIKKVLLVALVGVAIGILVYFFIGTISIPNLQNIFTQAEATWSGLPSIVKVLITLIPSVIFGAVTVFMAWTKNLAMKKAEQTEQLASQQLTQTRGEYDEKLAVLTQENKNLREGADAGVTELSTKLTEANTIITQKEDYIKRLEDQKREAEALSHISMHPSISDMKVSLEREGYKVTKLMP